jgi:hypothetical protein
LKPREIRYLGHWAIELAVVVVGVLLALFLAQWAEGRREAANDRAMMQAARSEISENLLTLTIWRAHSQCYAEQIEHMTSLLVNNTGGWQGIKRQTLTVERNDDPLELNIYPLYSGIPVLTAWQAAVDAGTIQRLDPSLRRDMAKQAEGAANYRARMEQAFEARRELRALMKPGRLSDSDRLAALNDVAELESIRRWLDFDPLKDTYGDIDFTRAEKAAFNQELEDWNAILGQGVNRGCWTGLDVPEAMRLENRQ